MKNTTILIGLMILHVFVLSLNVSKKKEFTFKKGSFNEKTSFKSFNEQLPIIIIKKD